MRREYNARGYLAKLVDAATNTALETHAAQDAHGNVRTETYGNGATTTRTFQTGAPRLAGVRTVLGTTTLQDDAYRWRSNGILGRRTAPGTNLKANSGLNRAILASVSGGRVASGSASWTTEATGVAGRREPWVRKGPPDDPSNS